MNLRLSLAGAKALIQGGPWIRAQDQLGFRVPPPAGTVLRVQDMNGDFLGWCVSDGPGADPAFRVLSRERHADLGAPWWAAQVERALGRRRALGLPPGPRRLVHGEADGLPGLFVDLCDGVALCDYASPGLAAFSGPIEAALLQQAKPRGLWRRHTLENAGGARSPWHRSPLAPLSPGRLSSGEPGVEGSWDMESDPQGSALPWPAERRSWRAWARAQAAGARMLVLGDLEAEAAVARGSGPAELWDAPKGLFKALEKAAGWGATRALLLAPADSKESFGRFDPAKHLPRLLAALAAACAPGALALCSCPTKPLWHAQPWEQAWAQARPGAPAALQAVLGPEPDHPDLAVWPQGRARKAFVFKL